MCASCTGATWRTGSEPSRSRTARPKEARGRAIRTVQELLGHADVRTTMIYTHVLNRRGRGVRSPVEF